MRLPPAETEIPVAVAVVTGRFAHGLPPESPGELASVLRAAGGVATVCAHCRASLDAISGVGLTLFTGSARRFVLSADGPLIDLVEDLQISLDQGPCLDSVRSRTPVLVEDLAGAEATVRWPAFSAQARQGGVAAMFAFPVFVGGTPVAVLDMCRASAGPLARDDQDRATTYAAAVAVLLVEDAGPDAGGPDHAGAAVPAASARVQRATGMVMGQTGAGAAAALHRLRAHAFAQDRPLLSVADDVLDGRLRIESTSSE
ncbi:GAF domain-containing protein [Actinoplanes sp. NPDC048796]|uniref:GAF domain-containing protein n=1 Tax=Actinoplanes sp. NPDC048796 TaxID=3155640 RepID=UPI0033D8587F